MVQGYFYNSVAGDRKYNGISVNESKRPFYKDGVFAGHMEVTAQGGKMAIMVDGGKKTGFAWINAHTIHNTTPLKLDISQASGTLNRIDRVVIKNDETERKPSIYILEGSLSTNPSPPELTNTETIQEKCLCEINIKAGTVQIKPTDLKDTRADPKLCGFVASQIQEFDFSQWQKQFAAYYTNLKEIYDTDYDKFMEIQGEEWADWFQNKKDQLTEDAAGNLLQKITEHEESKTNPHATTKAQVGLSNVDNTADVNKPVSTAQQSAINTVSTALSTHKGSADHDGRYYTETEMNTKLAAKQNTSTAINTSNIGNQRVNYATTAGSATNATNAGYATTAGSCTNATNAGNVGGYDANNLLRRNGGILDNGQLNITGSGRLYIPGAFCSNGLAQGVMVCGDRIYGLGDGGSYMSIMASSGSWALTWFASDSRLKKNIANTAIKALDMIGKIRHRTFDWKDGKRESVKVGYVAQELEEIGMDVTFKVPQQEGAEYEELYQIDPTRLLPYITKAIQEQQEQIEELTREIAELKSQGAI